MRGGSQLVQKATSIILNSKAIAKENRMKVFELLRDSETCSITILTASEERYANGISRSCQRRRSRGTRFYGCLKKGGFINNI